MYTTYGTGFGKFSQTYHIGTRKYGHKPGHQEQKEKKTPSSRKPHGFLNTRIPSIAPDLYVENDRDVTVNVTTKENLDFLYRSAMKYAQLLDVELPYHPTGRTSIREKICLLYNALDSIVSHHVNLELVGDRLQFCIYIKYHRMMDITDTPYFEMSEVCIDYVDFEQLDEEKKKDLYRKEKLFRSYEKGRIHRKLCRMYSRAFCRNLEEHIRNCNPSSNKEKRLLELITEGMSLIAKDSPHILNYDYDYASEKERDFEPRIRLPKTWKAVSVLTVRKHITRLPYHLPSSHRKQRNFSNRTTIRSVSPVGLRNL